jgi:dGTPase
LESRALRKEPPVIDPNELWGRLLSEARLFYPGPVARAPSRSEFEKDHDRVMFSSAFRRLKDKTQVFPLSPTDYVRTRLSHSLEASCVGRSLGRGAAEALLDTGRIGSDPDVATLIATACLAHDIGNPPFGHSGEDAIQAWARQAGSWLELSPVEYQDMAEFEGNAQGFRIMTRLQNRRLPGGIQPTLALLGAMTKYPRSSSPHRPVDKSRASEKKFGYFQDDREGAIAAFDALGMPSKGGGMYSRHPLAFLTEAADDICYVVMDLEDAEKLKIVPSEEVRSLLLPIAKEGGFAEKDFDRSVELARIRATAINAMTQACVRVFRERLDEIENGTFDGPLIEHSDFAGEHAKLVTFERENVYNDRRAVKIEYAGYGTISGLLDMFCDAALAAKPSRQQKKLLSLLPADQFDRPDLPPGDHRRLPRYQRVLAVTDYVSGMTDSYAVDLYQQLSGIQLPR